LSPWGWGGSLLGGGGGGGFFGWGVFFGGGGGEVTTAATGGREDFKVEAGKASKLTNGRIQFEHRRGAFAE